ncbi:MAG: FAD:protein FMN transferase [Xanthobacteraceae bacterium]|nr:FAD:protein FMN transferase [Xanthobacteraceae bacterium]
MTHSPLTRSSLTRRRLIAIAATAGGAALLGGRRAIADAPMRWRGSALGAQVSIEIYHFDRLKAERLVHRCVEDVRRLERQFSLYDPASAIRALNRAGVLVSPDADMVALLNAALDFAALTDGAFDPTVQPLWDLHAAHFAQPHPAAEGPAAELLADALSKVGYRHLKVSPDRIALLKPGSAITLNGIAQGYATDRVTETLRAAGLTTTLVDMGEIRASGTKPDGAPWHVGLADPDEPGRVSETIGLVDRAVATTAGAGFRFDSAGRFTHLFDPGTGRSPSRYRSVSVVAPTATEADALSTAFSLLPTARIAAIVAGRGDIQAHLTDSNGAAMVYGA